MLCATVRALEALPAERACEAAPDARAGRTEREHRGQDDGRQFDGRGQATQDRYVRNNPYAGTRNGYRGEARSQW